MGILFTRSCVLCGIPLDAECGCKAMLCAACAEEVRTRYRLHHPISIPDADGAAAALYYTGTVRKAMQQFKFQHKQHYADWFSAQILPILAEHLDDWCSATSFLRNWDSILEKKRANLRSISEPARLRQPPPRSTGAAHARGRAQSIREERRIAAPPVLFALLWVRLLPALYGPFCGPLRPFGGCPWGVTPPARECLPPAPPDTRRRG